MRRDYESQSQMRSGRLLPTVTPAMQRKLCYPHPYPLVSHAGGIFPMTIPLASRRLTASSLMDFCLEVHVLDIG